MCNYSPDTMMMHHLDRADTAFGLLEMLIDERLALVGKGGRDDWLGQS